MEAVHKITPADWMHAPETAALFRVFETDGSGEQSPQALPKALFVGGCVRNSILGVDVSDIDVATVYTPDEVMRRLDKVGIKHVPTGIDHGTVTAVINKKTFEITTLRKDVETFGRHAVVEFTTDWREDAQRRDFTMNTLLMDCDGNIYDPTGQGYDDLQARRVVFVGDPAERIAEDYLRVLRFFRFYAQYGQGEPDRAALDACRAASDKITTLSRERITHEFFKILATARAAEVLKIMFQNNIMAGLFKNLNSDFAAGLDVIAKLVVLVDYDATSLSALEEVLYLSKAQRQEFLQLIDVVQGCSLETKSDMRKLVYRYGNDIAEQGARLKGAGSDLITIAKDWQAPAFPLKGKDLMALGVEQGPDMGRILKEVEEWWLDHDMQPDRGACLVQAKKGMGI